VGTFHTKGCTVRKIYMARDGKYSHCAGKFTDTMRVKDQIEKLIFEFSIFYVQNTIKLDRI
jgi:hypothetical protein